MMNRLDVKLGRRRYPIYITSEYGEIGQMISEVADTGKIAVITDTNVEKHQFKDFFEALKNCNGQVYKYVVEAGEKSKNLNTVQSIYKFLLENEFERRDTLIAFGGGVIGDISGFVASTYLRGINFIQVPTSLLAQVDSSVGGKVGVNFEGLKNMIGAFYQPRFVYININSLKTLPVREIVSGLAEVIVHCIIKDSELFDYVESNLDNIFSLKEDILIPMIMKNCMIKSKVVEEDERDTGLRAILNFGHTIGHALESVYEFRLLHGECVAIGIVGAFKIARYMGMVDERTVSRVSALLQNTGLPVRMDGMDVDKVLNKMYFDKKTVDGTIIFILPKDIGNVFKFRIHDTALIRKVLEEMS